VFDAIVDGRITVPLLQCLNGFINWYDQFMKSTSFYASISINAHRSLHYIHPYLYKQLTALYIYPPLYIHPSLYIHLGCACVILRVIVFP
jgi:hypothetical protein